MFAKSRHRAVMAIRIVVLASTFSCTVPVPVPAHRPTPQETRGDDHLRHPNFTILAGLSAGQAEWDTKGNSFDGDAGAGLFRLMAEGNSDAGFGGGLSLEFMGSNDDLFGDLTVGGSPVEPTEVTASDVFPYFLYRVTGGDRFRMPLRVGLWFNENGIEGKVFGDTVKRNTVGLRFGVEPEVVLAQSKEAEFSLMVGIDLGFGSTNVKVERTSTLLNGEYDSNAGMFGFELGPRFRYQAFSMGLSLVHRVVSVDDSDPRGGVFIRGADAAYTGLLLAIGARL